MELFKYCLLTLDEGGSEEFYAAIEAEGRRIAEATNSNVDKCIDAIIDAVAAYIFEALEDNAGDPLDEWNVSPGYIKTLMAAIDFLDYEDDCYVVDYDIEDRYEDAMHIFTNPKTGNMFAYECDSWIYGYREMNMHDWYPVVQKTITKIVYTRKDK